MEITINIPPVTVNLNAPALERTMALLAEAIGWNTAAKVDRPALNEAAAKHCQPETKPVAAPVPPPTVAEQIPLQPPVQAVAPAATLKPAVTFEQLQAKAADLVRSGNRDRVKAVLDLYQVSKISQIPEDSRAEAMAALEAN